MFLSKEENEANEQLRQQAELRKRIAEAAGDYLKFIKDIKKLQKDIAQTEEIAYQQQLKIKAAEAALVGLKDDELEAAKEILEIEKAKLNILSKNLNYMKAMNTELVTAAKETSKITKGLAVFKEVKKDVKTNVE
jgi:chromosome segregation ATPase